MPVRDGAEKPRAVVPFSATRIPRSPSTLIVNPTPLKVSNFREDPWKAVQQLPSSPDRRRILGAFAAPPQGHSFFRASHT